MLRRRLFGKVTAIEKPYSQAAVGDIYCSDNTVVSASNYSGSGKTAVGIVINNASGVMRIMALTTVTYAYGGYGTDLPLTNAQTEQAAIADLDGVNNTATMSMYFGGDSIAYYVPTGWYVGAAGELYHILQNYITINASRVAVGLSAFAQYTVIVSSTEYDANLHWYIYTYAGPFVLYGDMDKYIAFSTFPLKKITY